MPPRTRHNLRLKRQTCFSWSMGVRPCPRSDPRPKFRKMGKQPVLVVNKMDNPEEDYSFEEFKRLFSRQIGISAEHGVGIEHPNDLFWNFTNSHASFTTRFSAHSNCVHWSSQCRCVLTCNRLLNMKRLIVSDVPGTTRETVELDPITKMTEELLEIPFI